MLQVWRLVHHLFPCETNEHKDQARPILNLIASNIYDLGLVGAGMGTKVVNNGIMHALMVVLIEAFTRQISWVFQANND